MWLIYKESNYYISCTIHVDHACQVLHKLKVFNYLFYIEKKNFLPIYIYMDNILDQCDRDFKLIKKFTCITSTFISINLIVKLLKY